MILRQLNINNVRNIAEATIEFGSHLNILHGENGSGKSSVLESIYLLSSGKSFRTRQITKIIKENKNKLSLFGKLNDIKTPTLMGLEKTSKGHTIHINGEVIKQVSALAKKLPVLVVTQDSHKLLEAGPQWRRQFLDWGLFHVKHDFFSIWKNYRKLLKIRNHALQNNAKREEISAWNESLGRYAEPYSNLRQTYIDDFSIVFQEYASLLLGNVVCELKYRRGWPQELDLETCLARQYERDRLTHRTAYGPHRGDMILLMNGREARDHASRGEQKLLVYALNLAQIAYLKEVSEKETLLLLDDLGSELDKQHTKRLLNLLSERFSQVCITTANLDSLPLGDLGISKMFHVKHGCVTAS